MTNLYKAIEQKPYIKQNIYFGTASDIARRLNISSAVHIKEGIIIKGFKIELHKDKT
jgi:hypothetical protein